MDKTERAKTRQYNRLLAQIDDIYHDIALHQGYSDSAMSILYTLVDHDGACLLSELVRQSGLSKQTVNSSLRKLEGDGVIVLEPAGGRAKRVCFTEQGTALAQKTVSRVLAAENKIYASWTDEEWELYIRLTERFLRQLRQEVKEICETT